MFNRWRQGTGEASPAAAELDGRDHHRQQERDDDRDDDREMVALAIERSRDGRHQEAIALLAERVHRRPTDPAVQADLAMALLWAGQLDEAIWGFSEALRLDPRSAQAQCGLGLAYQRLDRWQEAAEAFRWTEELAPEQAAGPFNLGLALHALGEDEEARQALLRAAALAPDDAEIRDALAAVSAEGARTSAPPAAARFSGDLGSFGLPEVLELMRVQRKTGALVISSRQGAGIVRIVQGRLTSASAPGVPRLGEMLARRGISDAAELESALLRQIVEGLAEMVNWREGAFSFHPGPAVALPAISFDAQQVVTELFRVTEERGADRASNPTEEDR